jgi:high affinity Mn2+ porin
VFKSAWVTLDAQRIQNPAYNADRGAVDIATTRLHTEF